VGDNTYLVFIVGIVIAITNFIFILAIWYEKPSHQNYRLLKVGVFMGISYGVLLVSLIFIVKLTMLVIAVDEASI
jgi:hypothetical protein